MQKSELQNDKTCWFQYIYLKKETAILAIIHFKKKRWKKLNMKLKSIDFLAKSHSISLSLGEKTRIVDYKI